MTGRKREGKSVAGISNKEDSVKEPNSVDGNKASRLIIRPARYRDSDDEENSQQQFFEKDVEKQANAGKSVRKSPKKNARKPVGKPAEPLAGLFHDPDDATSAGETPKKTAKKASVGKPAEPLAGLFLDPDSAKNAGKTLKKTVKKPSVGKPAEPLMADLFHEGDINGTMKDSIKAAKKSAGGKHADLLKKHANGKVKIPVEEFNKEPILGLFSEEECNDSQILCHGGYKDSQGTFMIPGTPPRTQPKTATKRPLSQALQPSPSPKVAKRAAMPEKKSDLKSQENQEVDGDSEEEEGEDDEDDEVEEEEEENDEEDEEEEKEEEQEEEEAKESDDQDIDYRKSKSLENQDYNDTASALSEVNGRKASEGQMKKNRRRHQLDKQPSLNVDEFNYMDQFEALQKELNERVCEEMKRMSLNKNTLSRALIEINIKTDFIFRALLDMQRHFNNNMKNNSFFAEGSSRTSAEDGSDEAISESSIRRMKKLRFPFTELEALEEYDRKLKANSEVADRFDAELNFLCDKTIDKSLKKICKHLLSGELWLFYTLDGKNGDRPFKKLEMYKAIQDTVRLKFPNTTHKDIKSAAGRVISVIRNEQKGKEKLLEDKAKADVEKEKTKD